MLFEKQQPNAWVNGRYHYAPQLNRTTRNKPTVRQQRRRLPQATI